MDGMTMDLAAERRRQQEWPLRRAEEIERLQEKGATDPCFGGGLDRDEVGRLNRLVEQANAEQSREEIAGETARREALT